ncbi:LysR family transcriptional regulator [Microbulbifer sp. A4B17]|uniref:LysR family transcriptional regulator n=1 Tax=Microbulbifer sp. A4B17 TaxID=359370 RepID=UPI000D52CDBE|nr:LysR family transcriptional regulator [Microbulbifer sp. A4B17]AWF82697.1 LysR family transcriptional regulator [Microbulbifer sp. A4B17]
MDRRDFYELLIFKEVAEAGSFTRAAARLGRAQSGISQSVAALEARLGVSLVVRSTRSARLTEAGQTLLKQISPALQQISDSLESTKAGSETPRGLLRITSMEYPARTILMPHLAAFMEKFPHIKVDIDVNDRFTDIIKEGFDAGIRFGTHLEKDMVAIPLSTPLRVAIVGSPKYFSRYGTPKELEQLVDHNCVNIRTASHGDNFRWIFKKNSQSIELVVKGRLFVNDAPVLVQAALEGLGLIYTFEQHVAEHLASGTLKTCLEEYCPDFLDYQLYYPSRQQKSSALAAFIRHLRET